MFSEIIGQEKAVRVLGRAITNNRLAHAYLFRGPEGVGKNQAARVMARALLCRTPVPGEGCGNCGSCLKLGSGNHPDFLAIAPDGVSIKIDQIRKLKRALSFPPLESEIRVVVMSDIHTMRREAANSLLKILEEPPAGNVLLLVAADSEPLLPTIISRCQTVPFYPLPLELAAEVIRRENGDVDPESAMALAALLEGSPGRALLFRKKGLLEKRREIISTLLEIDPDQPRGVEMVLDIAVQTSALKDDITTFFDLLRLFFKDVLIAGLRRDAPSFVNRDMEPEIITARERWNLEELFAKLQAVDKAERALDRNCNRALVCEVLFFQLAGAADD